MELIINKKKNHVSLDTVNEFEQTILSDQSVKSVKPTNKLFSKSSNLIWKVWDKLCTKLHFHIKSNLDKTLVHKKHLFVILMGIDFSQCLPYFGFPANKSIYIFDAWPVTHEKIARFVNLFKVNNIFFTSYQTTEIFRTRLNGIKCYWIPEGIKPELYKHCSYENKNIDVLALGRRYDVYHEQIVSYLHKNKKVYLYEKEKGKIIFPTREEFIDGLAKTKISVCVPSNITHPDRSGNIETMTIRYLQSMISKCIVIGHAPKEMVTLFGYNPVIEIDPLDPVGQLQSILANYSDYFPLIEKNYNTVMQEHTWMKRWNKINNILAKNI
jgi:serine/threonine protein kinase